MSAGNAADKFWFIKLYGCQLSKNLLHRRRWGEKSLRSCASCINFLKSWVTPSRRQIRPSAWRTSLYRSQGRNAICVPKGH